jgi:hypothetical protein
MNPYPHSLIVQFQKHHRLEVFALDKTGAKGRSAEDNSGPLTRLEQCSPAESIPKARSWEYKTADGRFHGFQLKEEE